MSARSKQLRLPQWWPVAALVAAAFLARLAAVYAASGLPFFTEHRLDALVYHEAGRRIASGDWSMGPGVLHMSPAYSYFVGTIYSIFGEGGWAPRLMQVILGTGSVALIYGTTRRLLEHRRWAVVAGGIAAFYGPFIFYDSQLLAASLATFAHALVVFLTVIAMGKNRLRDWAFVGAACGLAALIRPTALLFAIPVGLAWWIATTSQSWRWRMTRLAVTAGVALVVISPATARNALIGGEAVLITDSGGLNFYIGNGPGAIGTFRVPQEIPKATNAGTQFDAFSEYAGARTGRTLSSKETNDYFYQESWSHIFAQPSSWARLLIEKAWLFWNKREIPNTYDYSFIREIDPLQGLPFLQFWLLAPFALLGTIMMLGRWRSRELVIGLFVAVQFVALVLFFVLARYRIPAIPALIIAAVYGAKRAGDFYRGRNHWKLAVSAAILALSLPIISNSRLPKQFDEEYFRLGYAYQIQGEPVEAKSAYLEAIEINGDHISAHKNLAHVYFELGDQERSKAQWRRVGELGLKQNRPRHVDNARRALAVWGLTLEP